MFGLLFFSCPPPTVAHLSGIRGSGLTWSGYSLHSLPFSVPFQSGQPSVHSPNARLPNMSGDFGLAVVNAPKTKTRVWMKVSSH